MVDDHQSTDHAELRDTLRRRVVSLRGQFGEEMLKRKYAIYGYYEDAALFTKDFPTHEARQCYIAELKSEEFELKQLRNRLTSDALPRFLESERLDDDDEPYLGL